MTPARDTPTIDAVGGSGREWFAQAGAAFVDLITELPAYRLDDPGLGVWTIRDLVGHTSRSFVTLEQYLATPITDQPRLQGGAPGYYRAAAAVMAGAGADAIAERGRQAGRDLGGDPASAVRILAARVTALVDATPDDTLLPTIVGVMALAEYLPTRAFELTVHGLDLAHALSVDVPTELAALAPRALALVAATADGDTALTALLALTGRRGLPPSFSLL